MTIRNRLTLAYAVLLMLILLIFSGLVISVLQWALMDSVDRTLDEAVAGVIANIEGPRPQMDFPNVGQSTLVFYLPNLDIFRASGVYIQVWNADGELNDSSNNLGSFTEPLDAAAMTAVQETRRQVTINGTDLRVLTRPIVVAGRVLGRIQAAVSLSTMEDAQHGVALVMSLAGVLAVFFSLIIGRMVLDRAFRPVERMAETASQIATGDDLSRRIEYHGPPDELAQLTDTFNDTLTRLENLFRAQRRFVADVSHELRTPLTVIRANADLIRRYGPDDDSLSAIESEAKRMTRLVEDLLLLAQADAGEMPMIKKNIELDTLVLETFEQAEVLSAGQCAIKLGRFEPARVNADPDRLKQLLLNLISNAIKFTPPDGTVTLAMWPDGPLAHVSVTDTGEGIPPEDLPHIFERFYRVDKARARKQGGAGLGLAIAYWIAQAHGGTITVQSARGQGTTFTVRLPRQIPPPESLLETRPAIRLPRSMRPPAVRSGLEEDEETSS